MDSDKTYKKNWLQYAKIFCLITPMIISLIVLILVSTIVFGRYFSPYPLEMRVKSIEIMGSSILSIIGIAVTVWVGLNIYNAIERKEVEQLREDLYSLNNSLDDWKINYQKELFTKWEDYLKNNDFLTNQFDDFFNNNEEIKELIKRDYMILSLVGQHLNEDKIEIDKIYLKNLIENSAIESDEFEMNKVLRDKIFGQLSIYSSFSDNIYNYERKLQYHDYEAKEEIEIAIEELKIKNKNMDIAAEKIINHKE